MARRAARAEDQIQRAVFAHIKARGVQPMIAFHVPMGGARKPIEAAILKGLGAKAGIPDLIALHNGKFFALEIKTDTGKPTTTQLECISQINAAGGYACVAYGLDACLRVLETWGLLVGKFT